MVLISGAPFSFFVKTRCLLAKREWCRQQWQAKSKKRSRMSLHRHHGLIQRLINEQRVLLDLFNWMLGVGRLLEDFSSSLPLTSHLSTSVLCCSPPFRNPVLFFKARFETLQIHWHPWLRAFRRRPEILDRPRDW